MTAALATVVDLPVARETKLKPAGLTLAEHARRHHYIAPSPAVDYQDILKPIYWHHVARSFRPGDHIEVLPEDRSYWAELLVVAASDNSAKVEQLALVKFSATSFDESAMPEGYAIDWRGPNGRYAVIRKADKQVMQSNFAKKEDATRWLIDNRSTLV